MDSNKSGGFDHDRSMAGLRACLKAQRSQFIDYKKLISNLASGSYMTIDVPSYIKILPVLRCDLCNFNTGMRCVKGLKTKALSERYYPLPPAWCKRRTHGDKKVSSM